MSYCRWSCDDFKSDVYAYASGNSHWTIHLKGGETRYYSTVEDFYLDLVKLRDDGYHVPEHALDRGLSEWLKETKDG